ncbi:MAG: glycosyltransferase [Anaerolineae bacterium]
MRITIIASGSRGDVQPYVALGRGLQAAGHGVRLVTHEDYRELADAAGAEFWPVAGSIRDIAQGRDMQALLERGNFLAVLSQMAQEARRGAIALAEAALPACRGSDLLLAGLGGLFPGVAVAEKLGLPLLQAYYIPFTPTRAYPSFALPNLPSWLGGRLYPLSYHLARQMIWQSFRSGDRLARRQVLDVPPAPLRGPFDAGCVQGMPILYGYSPAVLPKPADWGDHIHVTGYWFLEADEDWAPPPALTEFLEAGPPPVYVGFGSMSSRKPEETAELILRAVDRAGQRAILLSGWGGLRVADLPRDVMVVDSIPFSWLFPRVAAVVHHGGAGTTAAGLRAGVPSVVIPFFGDQPFWGRRVAELGVGPEPLRRKGLTAERLATAIRQALEDGTMRRRAAELGSIIRAEDGVASAVRVVAQLENSFRAR